MKKTDFRDFAKQQASASTNAQSQNFDEEKLDNATKKTINNYSNMSENQLMNEMFKVAKSSKNSGELTPESLEKFYAQASPMMTQQQRNKLKALINSLKNEV